MFKILVKHDSGTLLVLDFTSRKAATTAISNINTANLGIQAIALFGDAYDYDEEEYSGG